MRNYLALGLFLALVAGQCYGHELQFGYYHDKCGNINVEELVFRIIRAKMEEEKGLVGDLVRLYFHDCFVKGCDASIFLDGKGTEKTSPPNLDLDGFDIIDAVKDTVEKFCPGVVSCADVLVMATRAAVYVGGGPWFQVETGRRDTLVSKANDALILPGPNISMSDAIKVFASKGFTLYDLVVLLGAHTVGVAHCNNFQDRLYNYRGTNKTDSTMDPTLAKKLMKTCPRDEDGTKSEAFLDQTPGSGDTFDTNFYKAIIDHKGVIDFDQRMAYHPNTRGLVRQFASDSHYGDKFGKAMLKLGRLGVLTGKQGEVRKHCRWVN
ncbi:hypothetical protein V2J09_005691 [Rumex salicifolius]